MAATPLQYVQVHRFRENVALSFVGIDVKTIYLNPKMADELGNALLTYANDIRIVPFEHSNLGTTHIQS